MRGVRLDTVRMGIVSGTLVCLRGEERGGVERMEDKRGRLVITVRLGHWVTRL